METPEEFRRKLDGMNGIFWSTGQREKIEECIATRDAAIRAESAALLKMCGDKIEQALQEVKAIETYDAACTLTEALAALREAGVME